MAPPLLAVKSVSTENGAAPLSRPAPGHGEEPSMPSNKTTPAADKKESEYTCTDTPSVYRRGPSFIAYWREDGKKRCRTFPTYEAAVAFKRDYIIPFRERRALPPTTLLPSRRALGWVYFFQSGGELGAVKVGWSRDPAQRYRDLSVAHPHGLELVALVPGAEALERTLHERFAHRKLHREWFSHEVLVDLRNWLAGPK